MPSVSAKQHRLMAAVATNPAVAKKTKIPQSVGKEFMEADKGKKFKGGGEMKESKAMVKKEIGFMKKKGAPKSMIKHEMKEAGMKKMASGGMPMVMKDGQKVPAFAADGKGKMASGGLAAGHKSADGIAHKGKTKGKEVKMALGGAALGAVRKAAAAKAGPMLQQAAARSAASQAAPKQMQFMSNALRGGAMKPPTGGMMGAAAGKMMGRKAGGLAAGHKEADGVAKKGKTKAMQVKMAGGGKTKKYC